jgi:type II secretory pathway pseudopilin PulG
MIPQRPQRGFTLIEIVLASSIAFIAIAVVTLLATELTDFGTTLGTRLEQERELELFMRVIVSELRSIGPAENGAYPIAQAQSQTLTFYGDIDNDGLFERVRYFLDGTTLKKGVIEPTTDLPAQYPPTSETVTEIVHLMVPGTIFTYFSEGYPPEMSALSAPVNIADIRLITATGTVDADPNALPEPVTLNISATIRNLRGEI